MSHSAQGLVPRSARYSCHARRCAPFGFADPVPAHPCAFESYRANRGSSGASSCWTTAHHTAAVQRYGPARTGSFTTSMHRSITSHRDRPLVRPCSASKRPPVPWNSRAKQATASFSTIGCCTLVASMRRPGQADRGRSSGWLSRQTGRKSSPLHQRRARLLGQQRGHRSRWRRG